MIVEETLIPDLQQAICEAVKEALPGLRKCEPYAGRFDIDELKKSGLAAPAVLVSVLGLKQKGGAAGGAVHFATRFSAFVTTRDTMTGTRDAHAAVICQALAALIPNANFGHPAVGHAENVEVTPLISTSTRDQAVSLWAVTWSQNLTLQVFEPGALGAELYVTGPDNDEPVQVGGAP